MRPAHRRGFFQMADKRVVYSAYMMSASAYSSQYWDMLAQLVTSITSYFVSGNTVPVIVSTDSPQIARTIRSIADRRDYDVDVVLPSQDMWDDARKHAETIGSRQDTVSRSDVTTSKLLTMLHVGTEYDRLIVDIDTLWFRHVPWAEFENDGMCMFLPKQWDNPLSFKQGQMIFYRADEIGHTSFSNYILDLVKKEPAMEGMAELFLEPWPNSGVLYITSEFLKEKYIPELDNPVLPMLSVEDETPLYVLLFKGGKCNRDIQMNVPVAFTDITQESDVLHPGEIICAHFHRRPKPSRFDITYSGVIRHAELHNAHSLDYAMDSMSAGQYGSMSGILWTYVWHYYYAKDISLYRNGGETPVYKPEFWEKIIGTYYETRDRWNASMDVLRVLGGNHE